MFLVLVHLLLVQLLITSAQEDFVPNVTVSTLEGTSFYGTSDMMPHPSDPNSLLLIDGSAILSLNVLTKQTSTVAGRASSQGYVEGVGESARFKVPGSFIIANETRIIVSDCYNHCLRDVDLSTGKTSPLAGTCLSHGYTDGAALQAQFSWQGGLLQYKTGVLVADDGNNAVRLLNAGRVSTLVQGSPVRRPYYFTERDGVVYISTSSGVVKLDPDTAAVQLIAGHESSTGFSDGPLLSARFDFPNGLVSLSPDVILLADNGNSRLRLLNLPDNTVRSICAGAWGQGDGHAHLCQLRAPRLITVLNDTIYVGDANRIRTIPLQSIIRKDPPEVEFVIKFCPPSVNLTIPAGQTAVSHAWPQPEVEGGTALCIMCPEGNSQLFPPGETLISYIYPSNVAGSKRVECNFTVSVTEVCPPSDLETTIDRGEYLANVEIADLIHRLPEGNHSVETKLTDGRICITIVGVTDGIKPLVIRDCPDNASLTLTAGEHLVNYSWTEPAVESTGNISCTGCPSRPSGTFSIGVTQIVYAFHSDVGMAATCLFSVTVKDVCPPVKVNVLLKSSESTASVDISGRTLTLPRGEFQIASTLSDGTKCTTSINITSGDKPPVIKNCPENVTLSLPAGQSSVNYSWIEPVTEGRDISCISCPLQPSGTFDVGITRIVYTFRSNMGEDSTCSFFINVNDVCPPAEVNVLLKPGERTASVDISGRMLTYPRGEFQIALTLSDGTKCTTSINITSVEKQPVIKNCPGNVTLSLPAGQNSVNYSWTEPAVEGGNLSCILCPPRPSGTFSVGITRIVYYYRSDTGMDSTCLFYITVREQVATEHCPPSLIEKSLEPGQNKTTVETPGGELILSAGETPLRTRLSNGTECLTTIVVKEEFEVTCPKSITAQLQKGTNMTEVSWLMPQIKGVNHSDVECDSCPANSAEFGVGVHTVKYKYIYTPNKFSMSCSFVVLVVGADNDKPRCSPVVLGLKKGERTAGFVIQTNQKNISIRLAVGVHELEMPNQSGETCLTTFTVHDTNPAGWSVVLQASYPAECEKLNDISYVVIRALLQHHFANLAKLCPECQLEGDQPYEMNCEAGVLVVQWTTGINIDTESGGVPATVTSSVLKKLKSIQDSSLSYGRFFDITVIAGTPLVVSPIKNNDGLYLRLRVVGSCPLPQMVYDNVDDACYIP